MKQGAWRDTGGNRGTTTLLYHAHVYFDSGTRPVAESLRRLLMKQGFQLLYKGRLREAHGPHPAAAFEVHFEEKHYPGIRSFFAEHRGALTVLIHPLTGHDENDHSIEAEWLGPALNLDFTKLDPAPGFALIDARRLLDAPQSKLDQRGQQ